jgi:hypothetical protein
MDEGVYPAWRLGNLIIGTYRYLSKALQSMSCNYNYEDILTNSYHQQFHEILIRLDNLAIRSEADSLSSSTSISSMISAYLAYKF